MPPKFSRAPTSKGRASSKGATIAKSAATARRPAALQSAKNAATARRLAALQSATRSNPRQGLESTARPSPRKALRVLILGAGKVGTALARSLRARGVTVTLRASRRGVPSRPAAVDLLILAVRDGQLDDVVKAVLAARTVGKRTAVVHCAGSLGIAPLLPLRAIAKGVAQMHPMISFASKRFVPSLAKGQVNVDGDLAAVRVAEKVARLLGMSPRRLPHLDKIAYHAAAGLVANGAAALAAAATDLLGKAGVPPSTAVRMLGPLLRSVADNVECLGLPDALTGPVRRGDAKGVGRHLEVIAARAPELVPLYRALIQAQIPLARQIGEADPAVFDAIERIARSSD